MNERLELQINYWKEVVEIRAESLKIEIDKNDTIDKIKKSFIAKLDKIRQDFNYFYF